MRVKSKREIPVLFLKGSEELGRATGVTSERTHAKWRREGLKYLVMGDGTFLYDPREVTKFLNRFYAPQQLKCSLTIREDDD